MFLMNKNMCGIIAILRKNDNQNLKEMLFYGLQQLQNRGYDSVGVFVSNDLKKYKSKIFKSVGTIDNLKQKIGNESFEKYSFGMGHTRWATHGNVNLNNTHPFVSYDHKIHIIHNGIIENYNDLKKELLEKKQIKFNSQTDSELIAHLLSYHKQQNPNKNFKTVVEEVINMLHGTWGLIIHCQDNPNRFYCVSNGCSLLLGQTNGYISVVSEESGFSNDILDYYVLKQNDVHEVLLTKDKEFLVHKREEYKLKQREISDEIYELKDFKHWTLKEIKEQPKKIKELIELYTKENRIHFPSLELLELCFSEFKHVIFLGCGTSYNAGLIGCNYFKKYTHFATVQCINASEFSVIDIPKKDKTLFILLSQSGETKDVHNCLLLIKQQEKHSTLGIINVKNSLLARETDYVLYTEAGKEYSVASTKCFSLQIVLCFMLSLWCSDQHKKMLRTTQKKYISCMKHIPKQMESILCNFNDYKQKLISVLLKNNMFILGKSKYYAIAREASLKIKEIAYIHAESFSTSALKHGPFALLDENTPVIIIKPNDDNMLRVDTTISEIVARNTPVIVIHSKNNYNTVFSNNVIHIPYNSVLSELLFVVPFQLIAYYLSIHKNINPDFPRNLAKSIVVH